MSQYPPLTRRQFLKRAAAAAAGGFYLGRANWLRGESPNNKLNLAFIGVGNQGGYNLDQFALLKENIVALCDVDERNLAKAARRSFTVLRLRTWPTRQSAWTS